MPNSGSPYKFDELKRKKYLELLSEGMRRGVAAKAVGMTRQAVWEYCQREPAFKKLISEAEMTADEEVEDALRMAAISGNVPAAFGWLYNRQPDRWQDRRNIQMKQDATLEIKISYGDD